MTTPVGGTRRLAGGSLAAESGKLLACVHCGFCLDACPTYTRLGDEADSPRGRLYLMRAVTEGRLEPDAVAFRTHIDRCLGCRACEPVCPSGVAYGFLLERARDTIAEHGGQRTGTRILLAIIGRRWATAAFGLFGRLLRATGLSRLGASLSPALRAVRLPAAMLEATRPWSGLRRVPAPSEPPPAHPPAPARSAPRIAVLTGCVQEGLFPHVNRATERVLRANGCALVPAPGQTCCGALHAHSGDLAGARALARHNIRAFDAAGADVIVVNAAGCGAHMKEYGSLLADEPAVADAAAAVAARVQDVTEYLARRDLVRGAPLPLRVAYDAPCHLVHAQRVSHPPVALLESIPDLEVVPLFRADECCGGAGVYGLFHPTIADGMARDKVDAIKATGAAVLATPNPGCIMQIGAGLRLHGEPIPVVHPIELLDESYRRAGYRLAPPAD